MSPLKKCPPLVYGNFEGFILNKTSLFKQVARLIFSKYLINLSLLAFWAEIRMHPVLKNRATLPTRAFFRNDLRSPEIV